MYDLLGEQTISLQISERVSFINFTWHILEYLAPNVAPNLAPIGIHIEYLESSSRLAAVIFF